MAFNKATLTMRERAPQIAGGLSSFCHAELAEIDENLIRANLTPAQEASAVFRRKAIYETLHPETKHGGDRKSDQVANSATRFTEATSDATGKAERTIRLAAARGEALSDDLDAIAGTSLDKGVELDALTKLTVLERDEQIAEWVRLSDTVSRQPDAKPQGGRPEGGTRAAARELGLSEPDARRAVKVAELTQEAKDAAFWPPADPIPLPPAIPPKKQALTSGNKTLLGC